MKSVLSTSLIRLYSQMNSGYTHADTFSQLFNKFKEYDHKLASKIYSGSIIAAATWSGSLNTKHTCARPGR